MCEATIDDVLIVGLNDCGSAGRREWERLGRSPELLDELREGRTPAVERLAFLNRSLAEEVAAESLLLRGRRVLAEAAGLGLGVLTFRHEAHPPGLAALANPPLVLFFRGRPPTGPERRLAVVGARRASRHGLAQARKIAGGLARRGIAIVSGLARGVDRAAHEGALEGGAPTWGVLGCGLARVYPPEHEGLAEAMTEAGGLLSEFSPGMPPLPQNFPRRNRLIAALADALLLIEAGEKSGGLITVRWATDLGREVLVLPGQVDNPQAAGCLALLRDGARPVRGAEDVLLDLDWSAEGVASGPSAAGVDPPDGLDAGERRVLALLDHEPVELERLLVGLDMGPGEALTRLMALELKGLVSQEAGLRFRRRSGTTGLSS